MKFFPLICIPICVLEERRMERALNRFNFAV